MANEFIARKGLVVSGSTTISGSTLINGLVTASFFKGNGSQLTNLATASFATTASAATSITFTPPTASFATSASFAPTILPAGVVSSSAQINSGSFTGSFIGAHTGSTFGTASVAISASFAPTILPAGTVSSSAQINTGSFTGSFTGTLIGTSSFTNNATSASFAVTASHLTGTIQSASFATSASFAPTILPAGTVSSSTQINTGSFTGSFTGTFTGTSSFASNAISSSFAVTASHLTGTIQSASFATSASFAPTILPAGVVSSSGQVSYTGLSNIPANIVSSSGQVSYTGLSNIPAGIVSSSAQAVAAIAAQTIAPSIINATGAISGASIQTSGNGILGGTLAVTGNVTVDTNTLFVDAANNRVGIGTTTPGALLHIQGNVSASSYTGSLFGTASVAVSASFAPTILPAGTVSSSAQINTGSFTGSFIGTFTGTSTIFATTGSNTFVGNQTITGSVLATSVTASAILISGSGTQRLRIVGSGSSQPILSVEGSQGELVSLTDSLSGSLFSVSDISGLPILEVFSDDTILLGDYQAPVLTTTRRVTFTTGSNVIYTVPTASYDSIHVEYNIKSGSNGRTGTLMGFYLGTSAEFTDVSTLSIGTTANVRFGMFVSGANLVVTGSVPTNNWVGKFIIRAI